jgi:hypothetical protein
MRKVLLATTALVAMSVTGAQADVSISGNQNFEMKDSGAVTGTVWSQDGDVQIKSTNTTDSGLTLTAAHHINTSRTTAAAVNAGTSNKQHMDDSYLDISGDFGSLRLGDTDDALDRMDGAYPANWDESGNAGAANGAFAIGGDAVRASIMLPSVSGATGYASSSAEGAYTGYGINYVNGPVTAVYQTGTEGIVSKSLVAINFAMSGLTVGFGSGDNDDGTNSATSKTDFTAMGAKYTVNDALKVYYTSQKQKGLGTATAVGGYYQVAPGLQLAAETASSAATPAVTSTYGHVKVSF